MYVSVKDNARRGGQLYYILKNKWLDKHAHMLIILNIHVDGPAHGDPDVGLRERERVVDPVARHRHHVALPLEGLRCFVCLVFAVVCV